MNRTQALLALLVSLLVGVGSVMYASQALEANNAQPTRPVLVAVKDIAPGVKITRELVSSVDWPLSAPLIGAVDETSALYGRVTAVPLIAGEPILAHRLAPEGSRSGLSGQIVLGKRAFTIKVNEVVGVAGFAIPGTYVDVLVTLHDLPGTLRGQGPQSKIVLERLLVLAAAQEHSVSDEQRAKIVGAVTLEVRPDQAETLDLARSVGTLSLALRNPADLESRPTQGASLRDVLGGWSSQETSVLSSAPSPAKPVRAIPKPSSVELYRGTERTTLRML
jgi:pilus assembly protein CpaB